MASNKVTGNIIVDIKNAEKLKELLRQADDLSEQLSDTLDQINEMNHQVGLKFVAKNKEITVTTYDLVFTK